jgi:archaellum component FlaC
MENRLQQIEQRISDLDETLKSVTAILISFQKHSSESFNKIDENFEVIKNVLNNHSTNFNEVGGKLNELKDEVIKIQKVSNYQKEYENLLKIAK